MKKILILSVLIITFGCKKKTWPDPEPLPPLELVEVIYIPGDYNSSIRLNWDYPNGKVDTYTQTLTKATKTILGRLNNKYISIDCNSNALDTIIIKVKGVQVNKYYGVNFNKIVKLN